MTNVLTEICTAKAAHVAAQRERLPLADVERLAAVAPPARGFATALRTAAATRFALIAEMKRRSPSGGDIRLALGPASVLVGIDPLSGLARIMHVP